MIFCPSASKLMPPCQDTQKRFFMPPKMTQFYCATADGPGIQSPGPGFLSIFPSNSLPLFFRRPFRFSRTAEIFIFIFKALKIAHKFMVKVAEDTRKMLSWQWRL